jgi:PAS domain S-box-containing protein
LSEERQRLAVEAGQIGLWYLDTTDGKCIWTQRSKELHGLTADSKVPDYPGLLSLIHPDDCQAVEAAFTEAIEGRSGIALEYRTRGLDFRTKWLQMKGQVQHDLGGRVKGIHGTVIDLTARREMEDKLRRANTELEQFAYAAAHDLQEPLRNVALAAALIQAAKQDPARQIATRRWASQAGMSQEPAAGGIVEKAGENNWDSSGEASHASARELLAVVIENAQRMEAMIKDLLAYSRALDTAEDQAPQADGSVILARVLGNLAGEIKERRAEITSDPLPVLAIQEAHLTQIMQNLIGNALTYSGPRPPRVHIGASTRPGDVLLYVRDNGIGIEPQFHRRAFGMFKRLHRSGAKGTGIGLAVCKRIVEHYGGKIWIESEAGEGATFYFTVPSHTI